jgi:membrane protein insertase Oxa1/YidC/SpoIIIJ
MDLLAKHNIILTILGAIFTFLQTKLTTLAQPKAPSVPGQNTPDMGKMM